MSILLALIVTEPGVDVDTGAGLVVVTLVVGLVVAAGLEVLATVMQLWAIRSSYQSRVPSPVPRLRKEQSQELLWFVPRKRFAVRMALTSVSMITLVSSSTTQENFAEHVSLAP